MVCRGESVKKWKKEPEGPQTEKTRMEEKKNGEISKQRRRKRSGGAKKLKYWKKDQ